MNYEYEEKNYQNITVFFDDAIRCANFRTEKEEDIFFDKNQITSFNKKNIRIFGELYKKADIYKNINDIIELPEGWDGEDTFPPNNVVFHKIKELIYIYEKYIKEHSLLSSYIYTAPLYSGGIQLEFSAKTYNMIISIYNDSCNSLSYLLTNHKNFEEENIIFFNNSKYYNLIKLLYERLHQ